MNSILVTTVLLSFLFSFSIQLMKAEQIDIILNEDELRGTCTSTCNGIPPISNQNNCKTITECRLSRTGWTRGFVRCDYCACKCEKVRDRRKTKITTTKIYVDEPDLYGTCTGKCWKSGLVRTNFQNCDEIRECRFNSGGWTRGFVKCDHCKCDCLVRTYVEKYRLENVKYNVNKTTTDQQGELITMAQLVVENNSNNEQSPTRTLEFTVSSSTSITNSVGLSDGLEVSVSAGVTLGVFTGDINIKDFLTNSYNYETGKVKQESKVDHVTVQITVPPKSSMEVKVVGHRFTVNTPYTGTLVTEYKDGTTSREETSGVYFKVTLAKFKVIYGESRPLA